MVEWVLQIPMLYPHHEWATVPWDFGPFMRMTSIWYGAWKFVPPSHYKSKIAASTRCIFWQQKTHLEELGFADSEVT